MVHSAGIQDRAGARLVVAKLMILFGTIKLIWADGGYTGHTLIDWALSLFNIVWTVVKRPRKIFKIGHDGGNNAINSPNRILLKTNPSQRAWLNTL